ncbi:MAG: DNA gyrase subunit B [Planctomycetia bacterium]|nr:DNA gyrase subunit B [Planctomycetia bacterium]
MDVDGSISVTDDGRGIPVDVHPDTGKSTLEVVMTTVGAGAKFDKRTYKTSLGLHGMGTKAVTALSEWSEAEVRRNGKVYRQEYERGKPVTEVKEVGATPKTGTTVSFFPDPQMFHSLTFDYDRLESRLRELAFLNKGLSIRLTDDRSGKDETFYYAGGVAEYVEYLNRSEDALHKPPIYIERVVDDVQVEVALQYTTADEERVRAYANNGYTPFGGTHLSGFRAALTRTLNAYGAKQDMFKNNLAPIGEDFREGLTAIVSVKVPNPQFESQTKVRLNNPEVEGIVTSVVNEQLAKYLEENPKEALKIMKKVILAAEAREAAAKAKKAAKERKNILSSGGLPGKLMDCTRDGDDSELFLVEGDSAGGSAESGRDRMYQAVLPLRGKPLNVEKAHQDKLMSNEEIRTIISAVGMDIGEAADLEKVRYGKIIILTDADVDGQHIRTLLLTFFYRQMPKLIENGRVFVARPPLYKVSQKKEKRYVDTVERMADELVLRGLKGSRLHLLESGTVLEGEKLQALLAVVDELEKAIFILERRGHDFARFLQHMTPAGLPSYRAVFAGQEHWLHTSAEVDEFRQAKAKETGKELVVGDEAAQQQANGHANGQAEAVLPTFFVQELHEVRGINKRLEKLKEFGLAAVDLAPLPRIAGREPRLRYKLENGDQQQPLLHLRDLTSDVRKLGEKGLTITRFKGLGEMDPEELWETTLDPKVRTLLQVHLEDALKADEMFRVLMGEKVEPRRDFIVKHALEVKDIDYHGA